jgi:hypothetical protein
MAVRFIIFSSLGNVEGCNIKGEDECSLLLWGVLLASSAVLFVGY